MKKNRILSIVFVSSALLCYQPAFAQQKQAGKATQQLLPYQNPILSAEARAEDLLSRLTLEEKTQLMMDNSPAISRLGIPQFQWWNEALHGVARNGYATVFPATIGMAASFDDELLYQVFTAVSDEARAKAQEAKLSGDIKRYQSLSFWTPNINIFRDPRWGRGQETYGEDPYLTTRMGLAVVNGLQGQSMDGKPLAASSSSSSSSSDENGKYMKLLACAKHFAVHSGPEWNRHQFNIENLPQRDLWETYLPAFKSLVQDAHVAEVMCAYQRIDGAPCCSNAQLERHILRDEWGFKGLIASDCGAIRDFFAPGCHGTAGSQAEATAQAIGAGTDVECGAVYASLPEAVSKGLISEEKVNESLKKLLVARFRLGDFDQDDQVGWTQIPQNVVACQAHKKLALKMAEESIVLLQNKNHLLPLNKNQKIVVMGPNANDSVMLWGNYSGTPTRSVTILQGIRDYARYIPACTLTRSEVSESKFNLFGTMKASYWNNIDMEGTPAATAEFKTPINLSNGGNTVFAPGVNLTDFTARYEGTFVPDADETLDFNLGCDDGYRFIINGDTLASIWKKRTKVQNLTRQLEVKKGIPVKVQIDYLQRTGMAVMQFDVQKKYIPSESQILNEVGDADVVVFVGGISPSLEGEEMSVSEPGFKGGDRTDIELPMAQRKILEMLHKAGKQVVFVNCSGSAIAMTPETENVESILQVWYPGELGGKAVAKVLFGEVNPSGKLPVTFYRSVNDLPDFLDYSMKNRTYRYFKGEALFPFGHGLSYTTFEYGKPKLKQTRNGDSKLTFRLSNTGKREGEEVAQVYIRRMDDTEGPIQSLKAFKRIRLQAGETRNISISLPRKSFETWDAQTNTMRVLPGAYQLFVGGSSKEAKKNNIIVNIQ